MSRGSELRGSTLERLLYALDLPGTVYEGPERRVEPRPKYRRISPLRLVPDTGEIQMTPAITRNLSPRGLSCIHHPFAYPEANVVITLKGRAGDSIHIAGRVLFCKYAGFNYHVSSLLFHERINLEHFLFEAEMGNAGARLDQLRARHDTTEHVRRRLEGVRIVMIDPAETDLTQLELMLKTSGATTHIVPYLGNALDLLRTTNIRLLLCGPEHDGADSAQIVELCRALGYRHPIVGMNWGPEPLARALQVPGAGPVHDINPHNLNEICAMIDLFGAAPTPHAPPDTPSD